MKPANSSLPKANLSVYLGSSLFFFFILISTPIVGLLILACVTLPFETRYRIADIWINLVMYVLKQTCGLSYEVEGLDNLPQSGAAIILSKHQSAWETIALRQFIKPQTAVLKKSLLQINMGIVTGKQIGRAHV